MPGTQSLKITSLTVKSVNTKYGMKEKWQVNGKWDSFKGGWNSGWVVGGVATGVFETTQNGNYTNNTISCPPELKKNFGGSVDLTEVNKKLDIILSLLQGADAPTTEDEFMDQPSDSPVSTVNDEVDVDAIV